MIGGGGFISAVKLCPNRRPFCLSRMGHFLRAIYLSICLSPHNHITYVEYSGGSSGDRSVWTSLSRKKKKEEEQEELSLGNTSRWYMVRKHVLYSTLELTFMPVETNINVQGMEERAQSLFL